MFISPLRKGLAELVVIVAGVLIALFAESAWNDHRDRVESRAYMARLSTELGQNLGFLDEDVTWTKQACTSTETALAGLRDTDAAPDPALMLRLVVSAATFPSPSYARVTYDDLVATGNLTLLEEAALRERIVSVYTGFLESINAWRPPKDTAIRDAAVRTLPSEYIVRVIADCLVDESGLLTAPMRPCDTVPGTHTPAFWFERLMARPDVEGAISARAWQVCDFERSMEDVRARIEALIVDLDAASGHR